ncbi:MAG: cytidylate kinase-like family protein [Thermodesulfobacteriota bacterium]
MSIITISRGSYSRGREVAEKVAQRLGYECIAHEVITAASKEFNIAENELEKAIHDAPSISNRFVYGKEKYVAYIQKALLHHLQKDHVIYHGPAGHFFVKDIPHVLKVRVVTDMEDRIRLVREQSGISRKEASKLINELDEQRKKWSKQLFGVSTWDPKLYDLVINIKKNTIDDAVDFICQTVAMEDFRTTLESQKAMNDLVLAADIKAALIDIKPDIEVSGTDGIIHVKTTVPQSREEELVRKIDAIGQRIQGIKEIKVHTSPSVPYDD